MAVAEPGLCVSVAEDRRSVTIAAVPSGAGAGSVTFSLEQLTALIEVLARAREHMTRGRPRLPLEGQGARAVYHANWYVAPDLQLGGSALGFEHPWYGLLAFVVPPADAAEMARLLTAQVRMASLGSMASN